MKLDEINDIEVLRNELKKHMSKCKEGFTVNWLGKPAEFKVDEYYYVDQEGNDDIMVYDGDNDSVVGMLSLNEFERYFETN